MSLCERFGRRGTALLLLGLAWILQGVAIALMEPGLEPSEIPHENLPGLAHGLAWIVAGALGIAFGLRRSTGRDTPGFAAIAIMPIAVGVSYGVAWATWLLSSGEHGWRLGIFGMGIYGLLVGLIAVIASWPEPPSRITIGGEDE